MCEFNGSLLLPTCNALGEIGGYWESLVTCRGARFPVSCFGDRHGGGCMCLICLSRSGASLLRFLVSYSIYSTNFYLLEREADSSITAYCFVKSIPEILKLLGSQPFEKMMKATGPTRTRTPCMCTLHTCIPSPCTLLPHVPHCNPHSSTHSPSCAFYIISQRESQTLLCPICSCRLHFNLGTPALNLFTGDN